MHPVRFAIDSRPFCVWDVDHASRSTEFLRTVDPNYFTYLARLHIKEMECNDRHEAALGLRIAYSHGLETLFAFLCACIQAPDCVFGWLSKYRTEELYSVVDAISKGRSVLSKLNLQPVTWEGLGLMIHAGLKMPDKEKETQVKAGFGRLWRRFARDFLDKGSQTEYNSMKHGLRVGPGGLTIAAGEETAPGIPCPPEKMAVVGSSEFGSTFLVLAPLPDSKTNFRLIRRFPNWCPSNLFFGLNFISMSLKNVVRWLRVQLREDCQAIPIYSPSDLSMFEGPWRETPGILDASFEFPADVPRIPRLSNEEILKAYEAKDASGSNGSVAP
jgi:hypothetical protein